LTTRGPDLLDALDRIHADAANLRAAAYDSDRVAGAGISDPTGQAAIAKRPTPDLHRINGIVNRIGDMLAELEMLAALHPAGGREPTPLEQDNTQGCVSCARIRDPQTGKPWHRPAYSTSDRGVLDEARPLCRFCWEWVPRLGELVPRPMLRARQDDRRMRIHDDGTVTVAGQTVATIVHPDDALPVS
jgi:hypothetical protein